ncbi:AAA family ATPase [Janthinobacterium sp. UMAB-56]|uniref:AAA family ATPase n=1 Tax=Janthinobacterium sp. UMAB-56 TaxID=1365361 RepID=UPI0035ABA3CF
MIEIACFRKFTRPRSKSAKFSSANTCIAARPSPAYWRDEHLLADAINGAAPKTPSGLLAAMEERQVTLDGRAASDARWRHARAGAAGVRPGMAIRSTH